MIPKQAVLGFLLGILCIGAQAVAAESSVEASLETHAADLRANDIPEASNLVPSPVGHWLKICTPDNRCQVDYVTNGGRGTWFAVIPGAEPGRSGAAISSTPDDALLWFGVTWQIDDRPTMHVPFTGCEESICKALQPINDDYIALLRSGSKLTLTYRDRSDQQQVVPLSLAGFASILDQK